MASLRRIPYALVELVSRGILHRRRRMRVVAGVLLLPGAFLVGLAFATGGRGWSDIAVLGAMLEIPSLIALALATGDPRHARVFTRLHAEQESIVWLFPSRRRGLLGGGWINVGVANGRLFRVAVTPPPPTGDGVADETARAAAEDELLQALATFLPTATLGFTLERWAQFHEDPASLRLAEPRSEAAPAEARSSDRDVSIDRPEA